MFVAERFNTSNLSARVLMRRSLLVLVVSVAAVTLIRAQNGDPILAKISSEGLERSQVAPVFEYLTTDIGPRLTGSPAHKRAAEWVRDRLSSYGLQNAHLEAWSFGRGWTLEKLTIEMIEPRYLPLIGYADAWCGPTSGDVVGAPVFLGGKSPDEFGAQLKGAIVMPEAILTNFVRKDRPDPSDASYKADVAAATIVANRRPPDGWNYAANETGPNRLLRAAGAALILR